jgi:hypothetical protein
MVNDIAGKDIERDNIIDSISHPRWDANTRSAMIRQLARAAVFEGQLEVFENLWS